jgi:hypothetical protein
MQSFVAVFVLVSLLSGCSPSPSKFDPVVVDIQKGVIKVAGNGPLALPARFSDLTPRGEIYIEKKPDGRLFIIFPFWYGRGADFDGLLYCSGSLKPSDFYTIDWGLVGKHQHIDVAGRDLLTVKDYKTNWYKVTRRLD